MLKLFRLLKPYRVAISFVLILTFLQTLANLYLPTLMSNIVDTGIVKGNVTYILRVGAWMLLVSASGVCFSILASFQSAKVSTGFGRMLRELVFSHVENFSRQGFDKIGTASLITRTTDDITRLQQVLTMMLRMLVMAPMMSIGGIIMAISKNGRLSLVLAVVIPILAVAIWLVARQGIPLFKLLQKRMDMLNLVVREGLMGVRVIRAFNRIPHERLRFEDANSSLAQTAIRVNRIMSLLMPLMMFLMNFSTVAIIWFGSHLIDEQQLQVGDLMAFIQYAMQIMFSLIMVSMMFVMIPRGSVSAGRINEVLETEIDIRDRDEIHPSDSAESLSRVDAMGGISADATAVPSPVSASAAGPSSKVAPGPSPVRGHIEFRDVRFSYPGAEEPALQGITFTAQPGQVTAIIGGTGSGKSTLVRLIPRFYDVEAGQVLVDGVDVREMKQQVLRNKIGFVPQQAILFTGSVAQNIRYGKDDASDEEIRHAAATAQADDFVMAMDDGYDSILSQGGGNLSGGQKQRLAIARALVRRPEIYIFDDSFSALDAKTDSRLRQALSPETAAATVLIVTQRINSVRDANQIVVLDEGHVAGIGSHEDLLQSCSVYQEIVASQRSEDETA